MGDEEGEGEGDGHGDGVADAGFFGVGGGVGGVGELAEVEEFECSHGGDAGGGVEAADEGEVEECVGECDGERRG